MALLYLLLLVLALQARPLHAAPLQAWGAEEPQGFLEHPPFPLDFGVETESLVYPESLPGGQENPPSQMSSLIEALAEDTVSAMPLERIPLDPHLPLPLQPHWYQSRHHLNRPLPPRGHRRGPPSGKYSGEGAKKLAESLETMKKMLEDLEGGQDVVKEPTTIAANSQSTSSDECPPDYRATCMLATVITVAVLLLLTCCACYACLNVYWTGQSLLGNSGDGGKLLSKRKVLTLVKLFA
ncbi:uncharacterized protein [Melanerpes formicivorus]|uniref:uncharacterized protein n=1 Tax=Melanerpes formicivorus TaxID=211600 RepID=UPI00358F2F0B